MLESSHSFLKNLTRLLYALILISGVAGPATLMAAQIGCEPACSMHQAEATPTLCCDSAEAVHQKLDPCHGNSDEKQTVSPACCEGKLCFDSRIEIQQTAALHNGPADPMVATSNLPVLASVSSKFAPKQLSIKLIPPEKPIPIYIRTCVFLI